MTIKEYEVKIFLTKKITETEEEFVCKKCGKRFRKKYVVGYKPIYCDKCYAQICEKWKEKIMNREAVRTERTKMKELEQVFS